MYIAFYLRMTYIVCTTEQGFDLWSCKSLCLLYFILPVNLGKRKKLVLSLWSQPLLYLLISLFINLSSWKKMAITLIPCFVSHSWTRDLVENIDFLMLQHCSLLFWIGGTILVLGAEFRIQNSELINDVKDDRNLMAENASIIHPCTFWGFSFQSLPATRTQFLWKRTERLVNLLLEWMAQ